MIEGWVLLSLLNHFLANIYLYKANNRNTRKSFEVCSKLTIKTEQRSRHPSSVFIINTDTFYSFYWCFYLLTLIRWIYSGFMLIYDQWKKTPEIWVVFHKGRHVFRTILWKPVKIYSPTLVCNFYTPTLEHTTMEHCHQ